MQPIALALKQTFTVTQQAEFENAAAPVAEI